MAIPLIATGVLQSAVLPFGSTWTSPVSITSATIGVGGVRISMTPCAFAVVAYTAQVFALNQEIVQALNSEGLFPPSPPSNLQGRVLKNVFLTQTDLIHKLTWGTSPDSCVTHYRVRRNGRLIGAVKQEDPLQFKDHNRCKKTHDIYTVTAVKDDGTESIPIVITVP